MEYNLLKKIEKPLAYFQPNEAALRSPYPSQDFINPGVGNINRDFDIFVPLHCFTNLHCSTKADASESDQVGFGSSAVLPISDAPPKPTSAPLTPLPSSLLKEKLDEDIPDDIKSTNELKRKLVGDDIFNQFMHPEIKTAKLKIEASAVSSPKKSSTKHKFKLH